MNKRKSPFDSVSKLAADPGLIGGILRRLPKSLRCDADQQVEPWKWLLCQPDLPKGFRQLFIAAQSQREALYRIAQMARRGGSIDTNWTAVMVKAMKAGNWKIMFHAQEKVFASYWRYDRADHFLESTCGDLPDIASLASKRAEKLYETARRKLGRTKADEAPQPAVFEQKDMSRKLAWCMMLGWLRISNGLLGLCFFTDAALNDFLAGNFGIQQLPFDTVRKTRQALGLRKAHAIVHKAELDKLGVWKLSDRHGQPFLKPA